MLEVNSYLEQKQNEKGNKGLEITRNMCNTGTLHLSKVCTINNRASRRKEKRTSSLATDCHVT